MVTQVLLCTLKQQLTPRQFQVVGLMAEGWSNEAVGRKLIITSRTVENHLWNAYKLLNLSKDETQYHLRTMVIRRYLYENGFGMEGELERLAV